MAKILIIVPAYNEEENIGKLLSVLYDGVEYDVCVVNDKSSDRTSEVCHNIPNCIVIDLPCNLGIGGAVQTGYLYAYKNGYDIAVQMDGDGQHDFKYLEKLTKPIITNQCDMTIGSRFLEFEGFQSSCMRRFGIKFFSLLTYIVTGVKIKDTTSGFRAVNKKLIKIFANNYPTDYPEPETNINALLMGFKIQEIPVLMKKRENGTSSISLLKSVWYMIKVTLAIFIDLLKGYGK